MTDVPLQIIVAAFQEEDAADDALKALKEAKKEKLISIDNAAVIRKDEGGKLHIKETADMGGGKGAAVGAASGAGAGTAGVLLSRGRDVELKKERLISFRLEEDLKIGAVTRKP